MRKLLVLLALLCLFCLFTKASAESNKEQRNQLLPCSSQEKGKLLVERAVLDVPYFQQEESNWCWIACLKMTIAYMKGVSTEQCEIANLALSRQDCCITRLLCNSTGRVDVIARVLLHWGIESTWFAGGPLSLEEVRIEIDGWRPIIAALYRHDGGVGHAVILVGYFVGGPPSPDGVYLHDPGLPEVWFKPYNEFVDNGIYYWAAGVSRIYISDSVPDSDEISLFIDSGYRKQCVVKGTGQYPNPAAIGLPNDSISSIKVGNNVRAILCQHDNFGGICETFESDDPDLSDNRVGNDQVSSLKVEARGGPPPPPPPPPPQEGVEVLSIYPSGQTFQPGEEFTPRVRLRVTGFTLSERRGDHLNNLDGNTYSTWPVQPVRGENLSEFEFVFSPNMRAPSSQGSYQSKWRLRVGGEYKGPEIVISFNVGQPPPPPPPPPSGSWHVEYFSDTNLNNRCFDGYESSTYVFKDWGEDAPAGGCPRDNWSARFTRRVHFQSGTYTFGLGSDDWGRIKVGSDTVVDNWQGRGQHYESRSLSEGDYDVTVEFADTAGHAKLAAWWWGPGFDMPRQSQDTNQWYAQYWGNKDLWWDSIIRVNEGSGNLSHSWDLNGPGYGLPADRFSCRFDRRVYFECGTYRFHIFTDDGVRFWIDGQQKLDKWFDGVNGYDVDVALTAGYHDLRLEHYENGGAAAITLNWSLESSCITPTPSRSPSVPTLLLSPQSGTYELGSKFTVDVVADPAGRTTSGVDVYIVYDSARLRMLACNGRSSSSFCTWNSEFGTFRGCRWGNYFSRAEVIFTLEFEVIAGGSARANIVFRPSDTTESNIVDPISNCDILGATVDGVYTTLGPPPATPPCLDPDEPNGNFDSAVPLNQGTRQSYICCRTPIDEDYFKFYSSVGDCIYLRLRNLPYDYNMRLYGPDHNELRSSSHGGTTDEYIEYVTAQTGYYYVQIYGYSGACSSESPYNLELRVTEATPTPTRTSTPTRSPTPSYTPTCSHTPTPTRTGTLTPSRTPTPSLTPTPTGTATLTLTPSPTASVSSSFTWQQEAEDGDITPPMRGVQDATASNCGYVYSPDNSSGSVSFTFTVPATSSYYLWARVKGSTLWSNSFYVSMDGGQEIHYEILPVGDQWIWDRVHAEGQPEGPYVLTAGSHSLRFRAREANARLDAVLITNDPSLTPTDVRPCAAKVKVSPASRQVPLSGTCTVDIMAENATNLAAYQVKVLYDPATVHFTEVTQGPFLGSTGRTVIPSNPNIDNAAGQVAFGAFTVGAQPGASGNGVLATITFRPRSVGTSALRLQDLQLADPSGAPLPAGTEDGRVEVVGCFGDFDGDNDVDVLDLQRAASHWGCRRGDACYEDRFDTDSDGDIDILDLQRFASAWGSRCRAAQTRAQARLMGPRAQAAGLKLLPSNLQVAPGSLFTLTIGIEGASNVGGFQVDVAYAPSVMRVEGVTIGPFLGSTGRTAISVGPSIDHARGRVSFGAFTFGNQPGASGSGELAYITFRAQQAGSSTVTFRNAVVADPQGNGLPVGSLEGSNVIVGTLPPSLWLPLALKP